MAAKTWFVCIDPADKGQPVSRLEQVDFRIQVQPSDPNYQKLMTGQVINWNGQNLIRWKGPFSTEAEAVAAQAPKQQSPNPVNDAVGAAEHSNIGGIGGIIQGLAKIGAFFEALTHGDTWRSVAWIVAGLILVVAGVRVWLGKPVLPKAPSVVPVPV